MWGKGNGYSPVAYWYRAGQLMQYGELPQVEERTLNSITNHKDVGDR